VPATDDLVLAIDQGTSITKVVAFDLAGRPVAAMERDTPVRYPTPERAEGDPEDWWRVVAAGVRQVLEAGGIAAGRIRGVGLCGFMHTLVAVDGEGGVLHSALLWPDQRCAQQVADLAAHAGTVARVTGKPLTTMSSLPRLRWLRDNAPEVVDRARWYLPVKDFLRLRLTGEIATDAHDAGGTGLAEVASGAWSEELLDLLGLGLDHVPPIRACDEVAGRVTQKAAVATGLQAGTPVVVGTSDWFSTLVGSGCFLPCSTCFYLGSAGILGSFASADDLDHLGETRYFGSVTSTGTALRWLRDLLHDAEGGAAIMYSRLCAEGERSRPGARGLLFLPHMMGERGGVMRPKARGALFGLTLAHDRADIVRAVLEGTAMWLRATAEPYIADQPIGELVALGGGTQSRLWRQICAATFDRRLLARGHTQGAALGTAMLAAVGTGLCPPGYRALTDAWSQPAEIEEPDPGLVAFYQDLYRRFCDLEVALRAFGEARSPVTALTD
jgi:xylulokinase